jgi:Protein of unknown function (DUF3800)
VKVLFLDESGDHNLSAIDPQYPLFVLGGVIVDQDYADGELTEHLNAFKQALFGRTDMVLHTADLVRTGMASKTSKTLASVNASITN